MFNIILLATSNKNKVREIQHVLKYFPVEIKSLSDFGPLPGVVEDGETFDDNAYKKALHYSKVLGLPAMADDSGLVVTSLGGRPGVFSARYAGENATDEENCQKLLKMGVFPPSPCHDIVAHKKSRKTTKSQKTGSCYYCTARTTTF